MQQSGLPLPGAYLSLLPLQHNRSSETEKYDPNERTDKTPEEELNDEEIDNLSDAEFKTPVIRMLTELVEYGHKLEGKKWRLC